MGLLSRLRRLVRPERPYGLDMNLSSASTLVEEANDDYKPSNNKHSDNICTRSRSSSPPSSLTLIATLDTEATKTGRKSSSSNPIVHARKTTPAGDRRKDRTRDYARNKRRAAVTERARHVVIEGQRLTLDADKRVQMFRGLRDGARYPIRPWQLGSGHVYGEPQMVDGGGYIGRRTGRPAGVTRRV